MASNVGTKNIKINSVVWWKQDYFSTWKIGKVVSDDGDSYDICDVKISNDQSYVSNTVRKIPKKFVELLFG